MFWCWTLHAKAWNRFYCRFWWRDTRLAEIISLPSPQYYPDDVTQPATDEVVQVFAYPVLFVPVPYHMDLSPTTFLSTIIPLSGSSRHIPIALPVTPHGSSNEGDMEMDQRQSKMTMTEVHPDGLLLYVSQASYEPGTSPLSLWIPLKPLHDGQESPLAMFQRCVFVKVYKYYIWEYLSAF